MSVLSAALLAIAGIAVAQHEPQVPLTSTSHSQPNVICNPPSDNPHATLVLHHHLAYQFLEEHPGWDCVRPPVSSLNGANDIEGREVNLKDGEAFPWWVGEWVSIVSSGIPFGMDGERKYVDTDFEQELESEVEEDIDFNDSVMLPVQTCCRSRDPRLLEPDSAMHQMWAQPEEFDDDTYPECTPEHLEQAIEHHLTILQSSLPYSQLPTLALRLLETLPVRNQMELTGNVPIVSISTDDLTSTESGSWLDEGRLVRFLDDPGTLVRMTEGEKFQYLKDNAGSRAPAFIDVTNHPELPSSSPPLAPPLEIPRTPPSTANRSLKATIKHLTSNITHEEMTLDLLKLTSFWNRSYRGPWGTVASEWIYGHVTGLLGAYEANNAGVKTSIRKVEHKGIEQTSVVARIEAKDNVKEEKEVIILGAHLDSLNYALPFYRAPGADDDGSGTVVLFHILRTLGSPKSGDAYSYTPPEDVALEFHWYAGEEGGLLGSGDVARLYKENGVKVRGMVQMDAVGVDTVSYRGLGDPVVGIWDTNSNANLISFTQKLVGTHLDIGYNMSNCGSWCGSDHISWDRNGYPAVYVAESTIEGMADELFHSTRDGMKADGMWSWRHAERFVKLGVAYMVELASVGSVYDDE